MSELSEWQEATRNTSKPSIFSIVRVVRVVRVKGWLGRETMRGFLRKCVNMPPASVPAEPPLGELQRVAGALHLDLKPDRAAAITHAEDGIALLSEAWLVQEGGHGMSWAEWKAAALNPALSGARHLRTAGPHYRGDSVARGEEPEKARLNEKI